MEAINVKKIIVLIVCLIYLLSSCRHRETYVFLNSTKEISSVSIVSISFDINGEMTQTEIKKIINTDVFLDDFRNLNCYTYYGDPTGVTPEGIGDTVIKISYTNDEYELINWTGQAEYTTEIGFCYYAGFSVFDENQFESLIEKYLTS